MLLVYTVVTVTHAFVLPGVYGFSAPKHYLRYLSMPYPYSSSYFDSLVGTVASAAAGAATSSPREGSGVAPDAAGGASVGLRGVAHTTSVLP